MMKLINIFFEIVEKCPQNVAINFIKYDSTIRNRYNLVFVKLNKD